MSIEERAAQLVDKHNYCREIAQRIAEQEARARGAK